MVAHTTDRRAALLKHAERLPKFSTAANQLLRLLMKPDVTINGLAKVVEQDVSLAARLLEICNSPAYGFRGRVTSLAHAIALIGLDRFRKLVSSVMVARMLTKVTLPPDFSLERFNQRSTVVATLADLLVQRVPATYPEGAFLAGLLHDIGKLVWISHAPDSYATILNMAAAKQLSEHECEREVLGIDHAELGGQIVEKWGMPAQIANAISWHHTPRTEIAAAPKNHVSLAEVIGLSEQFSNEFIALYSQSGTQPSNKVAELMPVFAGVNYDSLEVSERLLEDVKFMRGADNRQDAEVA